MELYEVMRTTPATRDFTDDPLPDEVLHRILDHARFAPSGGNRQGWRVVVLRDPALRERIAELYTVGWAEYSAFVDAGLVPFAPAEDGRWHGPPVDLEQARRHPRPTPFGDSIAAAPVLLLIVVDLRQLACVDNGLDRQSIIGGGSVYPFTHNILLAARNEGFGGVLTSVLARQEEEVRSLLGIPRGHAVGGRRALGRPVKEITRLRRRAVEDLAVIDRFDGDAFTA
jgi:nitroreductase